VFFEHGQGCAGRLVVGQQFVDVVDHRRGAVTKAGCLRGPGAVDPVDLLVQLDNVWAKGLHQV
jgi:hypothetical protein